MRQPWGLNTNEENKGLQHVEGIRHMSHQVERRDVLGIVEGYIVGHIWVQEYGNITTSCVGSEKGSLSKCFHYTWRCFIIRAILNRPIPMHVYLILTQLLRPIHALSCRSQLID